MTHVPMSPEVHAQRHKELHKAVDELVADHIRHTGGLPSTTTVLELLEWSYLQCKNPTPERT